MKPARRHREAFQGRSRAGYIEFIFFKENPKVNSGAAVETLFPETLHPENGSFETIFLKRLTFPTRQPVS
jgi:hypothetical protein